MRSKFVTGVLITFIFISELNAQSSKPFVPDQFHVPDSLIHSSFKIKILTAKYAERDYQAIMSSLDHLKGVFGPKSTWPKKELTLEDDRGDLEWHESDFKKRLSFTYTVVTPDESEVLGCIYIYPTKKTGYDVEIGMWVSKKAFDGGLDPIVFNTLKGWMKTKWPFKNVAYPGREISWEKWHSEN